MRKARPGGGLFYTHTLNAKNGKKTDFLKNMFIYTIHFYFNKIYWYHPSSIRSFTSLEAGAYKYGSIEFS